MTPPSRGFPDAEFEARVKAAQSAMEEAGLSALLLTTEPGVRYYTGFLTRFWESPTRPWFVVVPLTGKPIAVIPSIGTHLMRQSWLDDVRTWQAPNYRDDGISLLVDALREVTPNGAKIGLADQMETHLRMPLSHLERLKTALSDRMISSDAAITRKLRMIKSDAEIAKIRFAASIANRAFDRVGEIAAAGTPLSQVFRTFQALCLYEGADWVPYLAGASEQGGYGDVISPATEDPLEPGDVLMLDTGLVWDGYFCDFDRNYSVGPPSKEVAQGHAKLIEATQAAFEAAKPGVTMADLFHIMAKSLSLGEGAASAGRLGHGLGMQLTEWPSIIPDDHTVLEPGFVLTLEPSVELPGGKIMVHEENIVIGPTGATYLSKPQGREIRVLQ